MKMRFAVLAGLLLAVFFASMSNVFAQAKAEKTQKAPATKAAPKKGNIQGVVQNMSADKMTITVRVGTVNREVTYDARTKFAYGHSNDNKAGAAAAIKQNYYVSCSGEFNDKTQLMAKDCVYRETK
jgi:hypothetical protein